MVDFLLDRDRRRLREECTTSRQAWDEILRLVPVKRRREDGLGEGGGGGKGGRRGDIHKDAYGASRTETKAWF